MAKLIQIYTDEFQHAVARVPLGHEQRPKGEALIYLEDFNELVALGLSPSWNITPQNYVIAPAAQAPGNSVQVARVLLDAGPGQRVRYINGNTLDLRGRNILLFNANGAMRRDRDFVTKRRHFKPVEFRNAA